MVVKYLYVQRIYPRSIEAVTQEAVRFDLHLENSPTVVKTHTMMNILFNFENALEVSLSSDIVRKSSVHAKVSQIVELLVIR